MPQIHDTEVWQSKLAALPLASYGPGEAVFTEGTNTGRLLILKTGAVSIVKGGIEIAKVSEPGAAFGDLSALLDQSHTADVRNLETSEFHVADTATLLLQDPVALLYITMGLARRLDGANQLLLELKNQFRAGEAPGLIGKTVERIEGLLNSIGTGYLRAGAGYSMYPFA
jgi:CRP/FNR family cyclic AMP-dependent transcriptional regulator